MSQAIGAPEGDATEPGEPVTEAKDRQDREARLGRRLRAARKAQRLSLRDLAGRLDVSASFLSQLENGKARPSVATLYTLCSVLGVSMDELFRDEELGGPRLPTTRSGAASSRSEGPLQFEDLETAVPSRADAGSVVRSQGRRRLELDSGVVWEQLATLAGSEIDFMLVTYAVDGSSTPDERLLRHTGVEYGFARRAGSRSPWVSTPSCWSLVTPSPSTPPLRTG
jgi:transcriptional regulator with XRE-family HTH domain